MKESSVCVKEPERDEGNQQCLWKERRDKCVKKKVKESERRRSSGERRK